MTQLRQRMIECLQLRGLSERTQESYVQAVRLLAEHYHKSPDLISEEFIRRFLQHVLPKGFVKVRYYGLLAASNRHLLDQARRMLPTAASQSNSSNSDCQRKDTGEPPRCPKCGAALRLVQMRPYPLTERSFLEH